MVFHLATLRTGHVWGDDHCTYISHAKNIVEGTPYGDTGFVRFPYTIAPKMYPPVYPLMLAPLYRQWGLDLTPMKVLGIVCFAATLLLFYLLARPREQDWAALAAIAIIGFSPYFWDFKDTVLSDVPFMVLAFGTLWVMEVASRQTRSVGQQILFGLTGGVLAGLAYGTRSVGLVLVPAVLLYDLLRTRRPTWSGVTLTVVFAAMAVLLKAAFQLDSDYLGSYLRILSPKTLISGVLDYLRAFAVLWEGGGGVLQVGLMVVTGGLALLGLWLRLRARPALVDVFAIIYFLFICIFPWGGRRYLMPILPVFVFYAVIGLRKLVAGRSRAARFSLQGGLAAAVVLCFVAKYAALNWREIPEGTQGRTIQEMVAFVRDRVGKTGFVVFDKPRFLALFADTRCTFVYMAPTDEKALEFYRRVGISHVIATHDVFRDEQEAYVEKLIRTRSELFEQLFENANFTVYRFKSEVAANRPTVGG